MMMADQSIKVFEPKLTHAPTYTKIVQSPKHMCHAHKVNIIYNVSSRSCGNIGYFAWNGDILADVKQLTSYGYGYVKQYFVTIATLFVDIVHFGPTEGKNDDFYRF